MSSTEQVNQEWVPRYSPWLIAISVMLSTFMVVLDTSVANVALPHMAGTFSASAHESTWILTSYLIATGIILPTTAWFSNIFGRKNFLMICIVIFTFASILCGLSTSLEMMIIARILQGLGGGALIPIAQSVLWESFPASKRGIAMSIFGLGVVFAPVIGPTLGGWITDNYSWNWIFFINVPVGIAAVIMSSMFLEDPPYIKKGKIEKIDYIGFSALIVWLVTLQIVLDNGQQNDWFGCSWILQASVISTIAMIIFFCWELHFKDSIIDLSVFKDRNFAVGTALTAVVNAILYSTLAILPLFLQSLLKYTAYHSGLAITPRGIACILIIVFIGAVSNKIDNRILIAIGLFLLSISNFMFGNLNLEISMSNIIIPNIICGFALGFLFIPLATLSFTTLKNEQIGNATGIQNLIKNIGGGIGVSIVATLLSRYSQVHQSLMVSHLNPLNPVFQEKLASITHYFGMHMNPVVASHKANYYMYASLLKQSGLCSYIDTFRLYGILCLLLIPTVFIFKRVKIDKTDNSVVMH